uniref:Uncharacterized protein n=1 Tax=Micrurus corallinus TaxID=54390 RepID=A0A2D4FU67_MICCO
MLERVIMMEQQNKRITLKLEELREHAVFQLGSEKTRNLGVLLNSQLKLEHHLSAVTRGIFAQVRLVHQLRPYLDREALLTVTHALVTSRRDYCNALYLVLPSNCLR